MPYSPSKIPFIHTDPDKPFEQQVKNAVVVPGVTIKRPSTDNRPPLVFSPLYFEEGVKIPETKKDVVVGKKIETPL